MSGCDILILDARETTFFGEDDGRLYQWMSLTIESRLPQPVPARVRIAAGSDEAITSLDIVPGVRAYRANAPVLWPHRPPEDHALVRLAIADQTWSATVGVGRHRPWSVYLLSDVCTDYCWVYDDEQACRADDARLTDAEMHLAESTAELPEALRNHYNMVVSREVEFFLERYPDQATRLFEHIRRGNITLNPIPNMQMTGDCSVEELIRGLYAARNWSERHGLDISYANHQETPTIAWGVATVLAECGVDHLVKSILPYECPWAGRLQEPPLFAWEGPDGQRVLVRRRNEDYVEGSFVLRGLRATNTSIHDEVLQRYEKLGEAYPYDAIALVGCYGDLSPRSAELGARKVATIAAYNAQGWAYPRLINASHKQFWDAIDRQIVERGIDVPVYRGEWGTAWDAWPASMAGSFASWRRAQERAGLADKLMALLRILDEPCYRANQQRLAQGWADLVHLSDHAWNGADEGNRELDAQLRARWSTAANDAFDGVIAEGLAALSRHIAPWQHAGDDPGRRLLVFNGLGWERNALASVPGLAQGQLIDLESGGSVAVQAVEQDGEVMGCFVPPAVPSVGYRVLASRPLPASLPSASRTQPAFTWCMTDHRLEGPFYVVRVSAVTGGIVSLYDKVRNRELVDPLSPYHLNQCLFLSDGVEHTPHLAQVTLVACGPVLAQLSVRAELKNTHLTSTITLYADLDRVDIRNVLDKECTVEKQELDFAFPFLVPRRTYHIETPGAIVDPEADHLPGSGQAVTAIRHVVDVSNEAYGVTLSSADAGIIEFGHRTTSEDPLGPDAENSTVLVLALENCIDWHEAIRDQAGRRRLVFRCALRGHQGGWDAPSALRFGWEDNNDLEATWLPGGQGGDLPGGSHSFVQVSPPNVMLTTLKVAEEDGLVARVWEVSGQESRAAVALRGMGALVACYRTDALERGDLPVPVLSQAASFPVRGGGLATVRLLLSPGASVGAKEVPGME